MLTELKAHPLAGAIAAAARLISGVQVTWRDGLPPNRQSVFFANHTSHLDFVVLWSSLPSAIRSSTRPVAAEDYWSNRLRRWLAVDIFNALLVQRQRGAGEHQSQARDTIDRIAREMNSRYSIIIFPEGTRGDGEAIAPFKSGLYYLCLQNPQIQLVPAFLENLNRILPKGEFLPVPFISRVTFGKATFLLPSEAKEQFLDRMRAAVCELREQ